ncbi:MAG: fatty acid cis/trans isomerase [Desulfofustis sp.]|nr:fatty acid cis/trans isomerase [Desulfofustis sp.]
MRLSPGIALVLLSLLFGCAQPPPQTPAYQFVAPARQLNYLADVEPVLVKRCVVCHSCYNSPCQLKLSSWDGLVRGASKEAIYNAGRLKTMDPSRLLVDAHSTSEWREKGFSSVIQERGQSHSDSIMYMLLDHKRLSPDVVGSYYPEAGDLTCAENGDELKKYLKKHPNNGMPFGFPPLTNEEFNAIAGWLGQGAKGPSAEEQQLLKAVPNKDQHMIDKWEAFLNQPDPKYQMTARYLYEHLFLAHLTFETGSGDFYEMVRSKTGPGEDIDIVATVRPYDAPETNRVYYRFRKIYSTIVHKTHMVFDMGEDHFQRVQELFITPEWVRPPHLIGYDALRSANPIDAFEQIPVRSRYQWMLDNAEYTIRTYIRGPVCKGQVALNVIDDHFWIMFMDPDYDLAVKFPGFLKLHYENLRLPGEMGSHYSLARSLFDNPHYAWAVDFYKARQEFYSAHYPDGLDTTMLWKGNRFDDSPLLTVYRHFDSASVHRGVLGGLPKTMWVIDYPLLERIYYSLVAGFDVYGTAGHQLATRFYMDALRIEGESYFLDFMPAEQRRDMFLSWYEGIKPKNLQYTAAQIPAKMTFTTEEPRRELIEDLVRNQINAAGIDFDQNYLPAGKKYPPLPDTYEHVEDIMQGFVAVSAPGVSFFSHVADHNANVAWVRITNIPGKEDEVISIVIDRWHDNVRYLFRESSALDPSKDRADFLDGFVSSYPNYFLIVEAQDLPDFFDILKNYDGSEEYINRISKYGVNREADDFWEVYDWFQKEFDDYHGGEAGIVDLNRYYYLAFDAEVEQ